MDPKKTGPCDYTKLFYDPKQLDKALPLFLSVKEQFSASDGYQYDVCDLTRQILSNRFHTNQAQFAEAFAKKDITKPNISQKNKWICLQTSTRF